MNTRFHLQVHGYTLRGAEILASMVGNRRGTHFHVTPTRAKIAEDLLREQNQRADLAHEIGGNFFLDALTFHKSDQQRLFDTVNTTYDGEGEARKIKGD